MRGLLIHAVVFGVINALLVAVWLVTTGSTDILSAAQHDPLGAFRDGMWPLAIITVWGGGLVIHAAIVITSLPARASRRAAEARRRRRQLYRHYARNAAKRAASQHRSGRGTPGRSPGTPGRSQGRSSSRSSSRSSATRSREPQRPWVTAMFTDLVGSTDLAERLGDAAWHNVLAHHRSLVRRCLEEHRGTEIGTQGDGFLVRFTTSDAAVSCAIDIQRAMAARRDSGELTPDLRVGIHTGEAVADDNDLVGKVINLASRVTSAAAPNEIVITEPVADHASPGLVLTDRGLVALKGIAQPRHLLAVDWHADADRPAWSSLDEDDAGQNVSGET
jgi:class 3 adenylate cyclase